MKSKQDVGWEYKQYNYTGKFKLQQAFEPWPLWFHCSAIAVEISSHVRADHYVGAC